MIIDLLFTAKSAQKRPSLMILVGMFYTFVAMFLAYLIQPDYSSVLKVFFTVLACMPLVYNTIKYEEKKDETCFNETKLLKQHSKALKVFICLFIGMSIAFSLGNIFLPEEVTDELFEAQLTTYENMMSGAYSLEGAFFEILSNNLIVLVLCMFFSFIYGLGAIYILAWNASIVGFAIGNLISTEIAKLAGLVGFEQIAGYFKVYSCAYFIRYLPHGIIEMVSFFIAGLAMGIVSIAVVKHSFTSKKFSNIILDSGTMITIAFGLLILAAIIEIFVTPIIYGLICTI
ncbi:MAG: stage II sporulation protein M [Candidatus Woesearchaeota archaeon]